MCFDAPALYQAGSMSQDLARTNERVAEFQARDALQRGGEAVRRIREAGTVVVGAQRAAIAGQNILVDAGTALDLQAQTRRLAELDALETQNNAKREAWGYRAQSRIYGFQGQMARRAGASAAYASILGGFLDAATFGQSQTTPLGSLPNDRFGGSGR